MGLPWTLLLPYPTRKEREIHISSFQGGEGGGGGVEGNLYISESEKDAFLTFLIFEILSLDEGTPLFWEQAVAKGEKKSRPITSEPVTISKRTSLFRRHFLHSKRVSAERRFHCRSKQIEL